MEAFGEAITVAIVGNKNSKKQVLYTCFLRPLQDAHQADFLLGLMVEGSSTYKTCATSKVNFLKQSWTKIWYFLNYD